MGPKKVIGAIVSSVLNTVPGAMGALDAELVQEVRARAQHTSSQ